MLFLEHQNHLNAAWQNNIVTKLDVSSARQQNIGRLNIPVNLTLGVQVLQSQKQLPQDNGNVVFTERTWLELFTTIWTRCQ